MMKTTNRPWSVVDFTNGKTKGWIEIRGPNGEKVATIFPWAGEGCVGVDVARENAAMIVELANANQSTC